MASPYYAPSAYKYSAPYVHSAPIYAPAPYVHHAPALPYHAAPIVKAVAAPLAQSYTSFSQVVTHPQPIVKVHAEPVHYPVHYDPEPLKYTAAPVVKAAPYPYGAHYAAAPYTAPYVSPYAAYAHHY